MTSIENTLAGILAGDGASTGAVLHNTRFEGTGATAYGREAILDAFRRQPVKLERASLVATPRFAALIGLHCERPAALFADLHAGHVMRLWLLSSRPLAGAAADRVDVPFDFDLTHQQAALDFEPHDHPDLATTHAERVRNAALHFLPSLSSTAAPLPVVDAALTRVRPLVLRAFSQGERTAVLLSIHALRIDGAPGVVRFAAAALLTPEAPDPLLVVDEAQCAAELQRGWHPAL